MSEAVQQAAPQGKAPIIVALDGMEEGAALLMARSLAARVWGTKVNDLLLRSGTEIIPRLKAHGGVFCDPKLHDIPNTVAHQVALLERAGADLITLHCAGGADMLDAALQARRGKARLLGVTVLTSQSDEMVQAVYGQETKQVIGRFAALALQCGLDGIICSPADLEIAAQVDPGRRLLRVTPGVRPAWYTSPDDQQRALGPGDAMRAGADLLVVGRPITAAEQPVTACERILEELDAVQP
jgi:orotidine-5'-phosphate decarboxylase